MTTGDYGDDTNVTTITGVTLRFLTEPTSATVSGQIKSGEGASASIGGSGSMSDSTFDMFQTGRWHRFAFQFVGNTEVTAVRPDGVKAGRR